MAQAELSDSHIGPGLILFTFQISHYFQFRTYVHPGAVSQVLSSPQPDILSLFLGLFVASKCIFPFVFSVARNKGSFRRSFQLPQGVAEPGGTHLLSHFSKQLLQLKQIFKQTYKWVNWSGQLDNDRFLKQQAPFLNKVLLWEYGISFANNSKTKKETKSGGVLTLEESEQRVWFLCFYCLFYFHSVMTSFISFILVLCPF